ncbi:hypothetical protein P3T76_001858 [Phytophthora citrophthora]|uniref:Uncharacterized protein n=1 Tax=Phytophthora citrophthora TaxID=4793 RepID=A0AAD9GXF7_9STRA|nr:hypothetical protein P3T76_001858 [Phytophthora citrophthora]
MVSVQMTMNDGSNFIEGAGAALEHASFSHLSVFEWEALHRHAAVSGEGVIKTSWRVSSPTKNKTDIVKLDVSCYSGDGAARLQLNRWFCEIDIAIEDRQLSTEFARTRFLLSKLTKKAKEWALDKLVVVASCFSTMKSLKDDLRLAIEPLQDERVQRSAFLSLKQGQMSMLEHIQRTRHFVSCITTNPVDMVTQVHVFISGMNAGYQRFYFTRKTPARSRKRLRQRCEKTTACPPPRHSLSSDLLPRNLSRWRSTPSKIIVVVGVIARRRRPLIRLRFPVAVHVLFDASAAANSDNGARCPLRALLDSGATNSFVRAENSSVLLADI